MSTGLEDNRTGELADYKKQPVPSTPPCRVLIIDDEPIDREIFKHCLDSAEPGVWCFAEAETGRDGLRQMREFNPDCTLLDFNLPDLDGLRMVRLMRRDHDLLPCAVVMLTSTGSEQLAVEAMKLGVMDYLAKGPNSASALSRTVFSAIQRFRFQQEITRQRIALEQRNRQLEAIRAELVEEKERYRVLAENIPQLVWTADSDARVHYANQRLWDYSLWANTGVWPIEDIVHRDDRPGFRSKWNEASKTGRGFETELRLRRAKDQSWRWHLMRTVPVPPAGDDPVSWFGTFTDIDDQKRADAALRQREKLESIGLLAGGIAHEFNNLLAGIMAGASFAVESIKPDHPAYEVLQIVVTSSDKAADLTRQLLAYAGKTEVLIEPVDLARTVRDSCSQASVPDNIRLIVETADNVPLIETSGRYLQQVIDGLLCNAVEAIGTKQGSIRVRTRIAPVGGAAPEAIQATSANSGDELTPGRYVCIEVTDSGPGMDERTQEQIFDPFFTTKFTGRGLGLAAARGIVHSLGGTIRLNSAVGFGSTFSVLLPFREAAPQASEESAAGSS